MITIGLNGKPRELVGTLGVIELLETLAADPKQVAVAINGEVVPRSGWSGVSIKDGDVVEVVRAVGGG